MFTVSRFFETAVLCGIAVFSLAVSPKTAGPTAAPKEDLVAAAQKLALSGQRLKGQTTLVRAIYDFSGESTEKTQLINGLNQISRAFFGERNGDEV